MSENKIKKFNCTHNHTQIEIESIFTRMQDRRIDLNPDYQRNYVFTKNKASLIIESIFLNIPIPTIYLSDREDNTQEVIDGLQRLSSIYNFMNNQLTLEGLKELPELNGKKWEDLNICEQNAMKRFSLSVVNFYNNCDPHMKFEVFLRYNMGSEKLKEQELRNCLYRGYLNDKLKELKENEMILEFFNESNRDKDRFEIEELILRGLARLNYNKMKDKYDKIKTNLDLSINKSSYLKQQLNCFMHTFRNDKEEVDAMIKEYIELLQLIKEILGVEILQKSDKGTYKNRYDVILMAFKNEKDEELIENKDEIKEKVYEVIDELDRLNKGNAASQLKVEEKIEIIQSAIQEGIFHIM